MGAKKVELPTVPAAKPSDQVPEPLPAPAERTAPHVSAGVAADIEAQGWAVDPFTGVTLTSVPDNPPAA